jgi:hypothetical protein
MKAVRILGFMLVVICGCAVPQAKPREAPAHFSVSRKIHFYVSKLKDREYKTVYGHEGEKTWYTAAEELGVIGKPAVPHLMSRLNTTDEFERTLALYALLLASQDSRIKRMTGGEYAKISTAWDVEEHPAMVKTAFEWWGKYKHLWHDTNCLKSKSEDLTPERPERRKE